MLAPRLVLLLLLLLLKKMSLVLGYSSFSGRHSPHQRHIVPPSLSSSFRPVDNLDGPVLVPFLVDGTKFVYNGDDDDLFEDEVEDDWQIDEDANMRVASYDRGWDEDDDAGVDVDVGVAGAGDVAGAGAGDANFFIAASTLSEIALDYSLPLPYLGDICLHFGASPPLACSSKLGDLISGEQCFALVEAINSVDPSELSDLYHDGTVADLARFLPTRLYNADSYDAANDNDSDSDCDELPLSAVMEVCTRKKFNLPFGASTCLRVEQVEYLEDYFGGLADQDEYESEEE